MKAYKISGPTTWTAQAACSPVDIDLWFPENKSTGRAGGKSKDYIAKAERAKKICQTCPVINECRDYILANPQPGIWAGLTEEERKNL